MRLMHVLIVDDEEIIRRGLRVILEKIVVGFVVAGTAKNGVEALELLKEQHIDVVITDIRMPQMNGIELIRHIRMHWARIPIVILSGHDDYEYLREALREGVKDYLLKPVDRVEFTKCMEKIRNHWIIQETSDLQQPELGNNYVIQCVKDIIDVRLSEELTLQNIARDVNYNYSYLSSLFKQETGQTFSEYLTERRIVLAQKLLKESRLKVHEVGMRCGYPNTKYFLNQFRKITGQTPSQYRDTSQ